MFDMDMENNMYDSIDICRKLTEVMPELGVYGVDLNVTPDDALLMGFCGNIMVAA